MSDSLKNYKVEITFPFYKNEMKLYVVISCFLQISGTSRVGILKTTKAK